MVPKTRLEHPIRRLTETQQNKEKWQRQVYESTGIKWKIDEKGEMVAEGKRDPKVGSKVAAEVMTRAVESKDRIKVDLVNRSPWVHFDSYFTDRV